MPHRGLFDRSVFQQLRYAARRMMVELYLGIVLPPHPVSKITPQKHVRNAEIRARHRAGESLSTLAEVFGISEQRVHTTIEGPSERRICCGSVFWPPQVSNMTKRVGS